VVETHGEKDWVAISALVPGRTRQQCYYRWHSALTPSIDRANGRTGPWSEDEDIKLKNAVQRYGDKEFSVISRTIAVYFKRISGHWILIVETNSTNWWCQVCESKSTFSYRRPEMISRWAMLDYIRTASIAVLQHSSNTSDAASAYILPFLSSLRLIANLPVVTI
jgi:hypothetical protein